MRNILLQTGEELLVVSNMKCKSTVHYMKKLMLAERLEKRNKFL